MIDYAARHVADAIESEADFLSCLYAEPAAAVDAMHAAGLAARDFVLAGHRRLAALLYDRAFGGMSFEDFACGLLANPIPTPNLYAILIRRSNAAGAERYAAAVKAAARRRVRVRRLWRILEAEIAPPPESETAPRPAGLYVPDGLAPENMSGSRPQIIAICRGADNAAALDSIGVPAIGLPAGVSHVAAAADLVSQWRPLKCMLITTRGTAAAAAAQVKRKIPGVIVARCPARFKDVRDWVERGADRAAVLELAEC